MKSEIGPKIENDTLNYVKDEKHISVQAFDLVCIVCYIEKYFNEAKPPKVRVNLHIQLCNPNVCFSIFQIFIFEEKFVLN